MEDFIAYGGVPPNYRCDLVVNWTYERWLQEGEVNIPLGVGSILFGVICIIFYIPCCIVLLQQDVRCITSYKFLLLISISQIITLFFNCICTGVFLIKGLVYCNSPSFHYVVGSLAMMAWASVCISCLILNLSRFIDLWSTPVYDSLFGGKRVWLSIIIIFVYTTAFGLTANPAIFNSKALAWILDPLVYPKGNPTLYASYFVVINNEGTVSATLILTILFIASLAYKSFRFQYKMNITQKQLFIQSSFSSLSMVSTASIYVTAEFVSAGRWFSYLGLFLWQVTSAGELVLFLVINQTVRNRVFTMLGMKRKQASSNKTVMAQKKITHSSSVSVISK